MTFMMFYHASCVAPCSFFEYTNVNIFMELYKYLGMRTRKT